MTADPQDASLAVALETVRAKAPPLAARATPPANRVITPPAGQMVMPAPPFAPRPAAAAELFDAALGDGAEMTLLLDHDGYVIAGGHHGGAGEGRGADIGARLSGVSDEADRTTRHLGLGRWHQIVFETRAAGVAMAPAGDGVLLVAAPPAVPLGLLRRMLERSLQRARRWLESGT
jgi:predicted regulator of Ras-like GTPase activity (Roadblock/LC7/MglB family)